MRSKLRQVRRADNLTTIGDNPIGLLKGIAFFFTFIQRLSYNIIILIVSLYCLSLRSYCKYIYDFMQWYLQQNLSVLICM
jgi:hypothetical protein